MRIALDERTEHLLPEWRFDSFVLGDSNALAYAYALSTALMLRTVDYPLLIVGGSGIGKSHLLHAIGNEIAIRQTGRVGIVHGYNYANAVTLADAEGVLCAFEQEEAKLGRWLLDDVECLWRLGDQRLVQRSALQHIDTLLTAGQPVVVTAKGLPSEEKGGDHALAARLESGTVVRIGTLAAALRLRIVLAHARVDGVDLPDEVASLIAAADESNPRVLVGSLKRVIGFARYHQRPIDLETAQQVLGPNLSTSCKN